MTRFIREGRAVVEAFERYKRVFQIGTFGRFGASRSNNSKLVHKIMRSGVLDPNPCVHIKKGGLKIHQWSGRPGLPPQTPPSTLDWDLYCGPSPFKPYDGPPVGGTHRGYWDYEGGGLCDMGQHHFDPMQWIHGKDDTSPVTIEAYAPPAHPDVTGMWAWVELTYADGFTFVMDSNEWGPRYDRKPENPSGPTSSPRNNSTRSTPNPTLNRFFHLLKPFSNASKQVAILKQPTVQLASCTLPTLLFALDGNYSMTRKKRYSSMTQKQIASSMYPCAPLGTCKPTF